MANGTDISRLARQVKRAVTLNKKKQMFISKLIIRAKLYQEQNIDQHLL